MVVRGLLEGALDAPGVLHQGRKTDGWSESPQLAKSADLECLPDGRNDHLGKAGVLASRLLWNRTPVTHHSTPDVTARVRCAYHRLSCVRSQPRR